MECQARLERYFRENEVAFQTMEHPTAYTAQEVAAAQQVPGRIVAKVVMAMVDGEARMLVTTAPERVDLIKLRAVLHAHDVRLAHEADFARLFPDCDTGAMPPFGNLYNIPVLVDYCVAQDPILIFQAGSHRDTMMIAYADYERLVRPRVADFCIMEEWVHA